ncbi:MAG: hypothetical protein GSR74_04245 [Desulfurococcales archaeon]|nr:hypothetical protein [Desulfurococcales archaeon]
MKSRPPSGGAASSGNDGEEHSRRCYNCEYWRPHVHYPYIGYCVLHQKFTMDTDTCDNWTPLKIREGDFYWCSTCKTRITGEEARKLLEKGHRVHRGAYVDPDVREELYSVF